MKFCKLRIAWSVFWALACVLLIVLWVRSYAWLDRSDWQPMRTFILTIQTCRGILSFDACDDQDFSQFTKSGWQLKHYPMEERFTVHGNPRYSFSSTPTHVELDFRCPIWLLVLPPAASAIIPWIGSALRLRRFSLRTLLIATTLVAVVLGLAVWAASK